MRVLLTGGAGTVAGAMAAAQVPFEVHLTWRHRRPAHDLPIHRIELVDGAAVGALVAGLRPDVVVHAAYSPGERRDIVDATGHVAAACAATGASLVQLSTDAVFDGEHAPYAELDEPVPCNDYGRWKLEAERLALAHVPDACITRSSLVVSMDPPDPSTAAVLQAARSVVAMTLFTDELRQPILAEDLAAELWALVGLTRAERGGVWHLPGAVVWSRAQLGRRVCELAGVDPSGLVDSLQSEHPGVRPRDLTMTSTRRDRLAHPPRKI